MNQSTPTSLKILVERVVRPVQAGPSRKRKMREELLAHVNAVFEEEAAKTGDERLALKQTAQRFGNPAELKEQLQQSVPPSDRWAIFLESLLVGNGVSTWQLAFRYAFFALLPCAIQLIAYSMQGRLAEWPIALAWPVLAFVTVFLAMGMRDALFGPGGQSWSNVILLSAVAWLLMSGVTFALCLNFSGNWRSSLMDAVPLLPLGFMVPAALIIATFAFSADTYKQREWAALRLD